MISYGICLSLSGLLHLARIISSCIHVAANGIISFFFMAEYYSIVYMHHIFFIHSSIRGYLGCFYILAIVNTAAVNTGVHASFQITVFLDTCSRMGLRDHMVVLFLVFKGSSILFSIVIVPT